MTLGLFIFIKDMTMKTSLPEHVKRFIDGKIEQLLLNGNSKISAATLIITELKVIFDLTPEQFARANDYAISKIVEFNINPINN